jgi:hypothetical protein
MAKTRNFSVTDEQDEQINNALRLVPFAMNQSAKIRFICDFYLLHHNEDADIERQIHKLNQTNDAYENATTTLEGFCIWDKDKRIWLTPRHYICRNIQCKNEPDCIAYRIRQLCMSKIDDPTVASTDNPEEMLYDMDIALSSTPQIRDPNVRKILEDDIYRTALERVNANDKP